MSDPELNKILDKKLSNLTVRGTSKMSNTMDLSNENFYQVINGDKPVLVDFWAEWCGPCRIMHPVLEKLAQKYYDKIVFARINVDENSEVAAQYKVLSIPTFMIFIKGKPTDMVIGAVGESGLEKLVRKFI